MFKISFASSILCQSVSLLFSLPRFNNVKRINGDIKAV